MLRKGVYPYKYKDHSEKFSEISLPGKEDFCSYLNITDVTYTDYTHAKRVCKNLKKIRGKSWFG